MQQKNDDDVVVFAEYGNEIDANIVKGVLMDNGVRAGVLGDSTANALFHMMNEGNYKVVVLRGDLERAHAIMDANPIEIEGDDTSHDDDDEEPHD